MKLPNGYGSIVKLSGNRRRPWMVRKTKERTQQGPKYFILGYFSTREEAMAALVDFNRRDVTIDRASIVLDKLYSEWYQQQRDLVGDSSLEGYRTAWRHFEPLRDRKVANIKKTHIQAIVDLMRDDYSKSAMTKVKMLMTMLMDYAMADDIIDKNYAKLVRIPKKPEIRKESFTDAEIKTLFEHDNLLGIKTALIMIYTGMRISELMSLTKFDVDIDNMIITGGVKTDAGKNRTIPVSSKVQSYIRELYSSEGEYLLNLNGKTIKHKTDNYRRKIYYPDLATAGISKEGHSPHACRYTFALLLERSGASQVSAQKLMGHADFSTTANIYTNPDITMLRSVIDNI